ncbi:hypothetical protein TIFTF001_024347 [Ficus carica]|uniref:Uncharacterized protein n=1 Tax=Ficus carica TaxID=3494 RepID=A0AA88AHU9_FICCA|nr:hypothetical protein TIFTF001_024347 [Ficus carica]
MGEAEDGAPPPAAARGGGGGASASEKAISRSRNKPKEEVLEVKCESSGKTRRFAPGTEAGFAVSVINQKLLHQYQSDLQINSNSSSKTPPPPPLAVHIEAFKQGSDDDDDADVDEEEPITFGPNSLLLNYGPRWILHTVLSHPLPSTPPSSGVADKDGIPIPPPVVINKPVPPPVHLKRLLSNLESSSIGLFVTAA